MENSVLEKIFAKIKKTPTDIEPYADAIALIKSDNDAHEYSKTLRNLCAERIKERCDNVEAYYAIYKETLLYDARTDFDSYMLYLEIDREPSERFYQPRRKVLHDVVKKMQMLADDELDELFISCPPRIGKTTLDIMFMTWLMGRNPESSNLYSAYSDIITTAFHNGVLEILTDKVTYNWGKIFPDLKIASTNSKDETIDIKRKKHYPSLTARSLYGTLNGACDVNGVLVADDLIGGIEEALNKDRMVAAWSKVDNNLIPRAKQKAKILWVGTRWSMIDPAGLRMSLLENDDNFRNRRYEIINIPALDENDESNFNYQYGVGFDTAYYRQRRASFERNNDMASWFAQYQGVPIEREGTLFSPDDFRTYNGELPSELPDRIFMAVDPAFGGGDYVASPVCYQYGEDIYVADVVYSTENKSITQKMLANMVVKHKVNAMQIEANKSTESYKEGVEKLLRDKGIRINLTAKPAPNTTSKEARIFDKAPEIRERMIFLENGKRSRDYDLFMQNVFSFKMTGKNKHDDAPDSLCMAISMISQKAKVIRSFNRFL